MTVLNHYPVEEIALGTGNSIDLSYCDICLVFAVPKEEVTFTPSMSTNHIHVAKNSTQLAVVKTRQESQDRHIRTTARNPAHSEVESESSDDENDTASQSSEESEEMTQHTRKQMKVDPEMVESAPPLK